MKYKKISIVCTFIFVSFLTECQVQRNIQDLANFTGQALVDIAPAQLPDANTQKAIQAYINNINYQQTKLKYEFGKAALEDMQKGLAILTFIESIVKMQDNYREGTTIWKSKAIYNGWKRIEDWATVAGSVVAAGSLLAESNSDQKAGGAVVGLGIIGIPKLIGLLLGKNSKTESVIDSTYRNFAMSYDAYNELAFIKVELQSFLDNNKTLSNSLNSFQDSYLKANRDGENLADTAKQNITDKKNKALSSLLDISTRYNQALGQIDIYLGHLNAFNSRFATNHPYFKDRFINLKTTTESIQKQYDEQVVPLLKVDISRIILQAQLPTN